MRGHRIALAPNDAQATYLARAAGTARFAYNWALAEWQRQYREHREDESLPKPSQQALRRQLNAIKREKFPWMLEVTKNAPQMAIVHLGDAFRNFFAKRARYPRFRRKGVHDRFTLSNDQFRIEGRRIHIPKLGWVRMREGLRFTGKVVSATISRTADRWFVAVNVDTHDLSPLPVAENQGAVGVDLGVLALAVLSTGEKVAGPRPYRRLLKRRQRLARSVSRKLKDSSNRRKDQRRLARLDARIANVRADALHKLTTDLSRRFDMIGIEDLNVRGMMANRHLARAVGDAGFREFRRQVEYKAPMRGGLVVVAGRWFPSSKMCSAGGQRRERLPLSVRHWTCTACGSGHDRDVNAAVNLRSHAVSSTVKACGEACSGRDGGVRRIVPVNPASAKQEVSFGYV